MKTYTKEQIENGMLSAQELLLSFSVGNNAATLTPSLMKGIHNGAVQGKTVSLAVLTAYAEFMAAKSSELAEALQAGYIVPRHRIQYAESKTKTVKPLVGHYLTASEYLQSCFDLLPPLLTPTFEDILSTLDGYKPSMNKTELTQIIENVISLCTPKSYSVDDLTDDQRIKYNDLTYKELALEAATTALCVYLDDIKPVADNMLQGKYYISRRSMPSLRQMLDQEKWSVIVDTPVPTKVDTDYNITEEEHRLFTIQVL